MRDLVNHWSFMIRKRFDGLMHSLFPDKWIPLYTTVTFSRMRYHLCIKNKEWQDKVKSLATLVLDSLLSIWKIWGRGGRPNSIQFLRLPNNLREAVVLN